MFNQKYPNKVTFIFSFAISLIAAWIGADLVGRVLKELGKYYLEVDIESSVSGNVELFWDTGNGFNAGESTVFRIRNPNRKGSAFFRLPKASIMNFRFDPIDAPGVVKIYDIRIVNGLFHVFDSVTSKVNLIPVTGIERLEPADHGWVVHSENHDPVMLLALDYPMLNEMRQEPPIGGLLVEIGIGILIFGVGITGFRFFGIWMIPLLVSVFVWAVFYPGVFTPDSLEHIEEALSGRYCNWHPSIIPVVLHFLFRTGLTLPGILFAQTLFGNLCVLWLVHEICLASCRLLGWKLPRTAIWWGAISVFGFLYSPLTPFALFIVTLWKDVWFTIVELALISLTLSLFRNYASGRDSGKMGQVRKYGMLSGLLMLMLLSLNLRNNAITLIPLYVAILWILGIPRSIWMRSLMCVLSLLPFIKLHSWIDSIFDVVDVNPKSSIMSLEMLGLFELRPDLKPEFPYVSSQLLEGWENEYEWAAFRKLKWNDKPFVGEDLVKSEPNPELYTEYTKAILHHPILMFQVKLKNFMLLLDPFKTTEWFVWGISDNDFGLRVNEYADDYHNRFLALILLVKSNRVLRWISAVNIVWLGIGGFLIVTLWLRRKTDPLRLLISALLLIPMFYAGSYLLATPWKAFRYLYPSTLIIQIVFISLLSYCVTGWRSSVSKKTY